MDSLYFTKEEYQKLFQALGKENCMVMEHMLMKAYGIIDMQDLKMEKPWILPFLLYVQEL